MVLADLGSKIAVALRKMTQTTVIDQTVMNDMLQEICKALLQADINIAQVKHLREQVKKGVDIEQMAGGINKRKVLEQSVINELCSMLDPGRVPYVPKKKQPNVIMFVGLQVRACPAAPAVPPRLGRRGGRAAGCSAVCVWVRRAAETAAAARACAGVRQDDDVHQVRVHDEAEGLQVLPRLCAPLGGREPAAGSLASPPWRAGVLLSAPGPPWPLSSRKGLCRR